MTWQIIRNEDLEDLREMGSGAFGTVFHGKWKGTDVAIKRIKNSCFMLPSHQADKLVSVQNLIKNSQPRVLWLSSWDQFRLLTSL